MHRIESFAELKKLSSNGGIEVAILLLGGTIRSSKFVEYNPATKKWRIENYIDGSTALRLSDTNIRQAIINKTLVVEDLK